jgi:tetratricopeptide (TPR) repeat protein
MNNDRSKNNVFGSFFWQNVRESKKIKNNKIIIFLLIIFLIFCDAKSFGQFGSGCVSSTNIIASNENGYAIVFVNGNSSNCNYIKELNLNNQDNTYIERYQNGDVQVLTKSIGTSKFDYRGLIYSYSKKPFIRIGYDKYPGLKISDSRDKSRYKEITYIDGIKSTNSDFDQGTPRSIQKESYTGSLNDIIESAIKETRKDIIGFSNETLSLSEKKMPLFIDSINKAYKNELLTKISKTKQKISLTKEELEDLYLELKFAENGGYFDEVTSIFNILIAKSPKGIVGISKMDQPTMYTYLRGDFYKRINKFDLAINDYKKCLSAVTDLESKSTFNYNISECYEKLGDKKNAALYWSLVKDKIDKDIENRSTIESKQSAKKFCVRTTNSMYELTFFEGGANSLLYKLYNNQGNLLKTMQGKWKMQDEGVYGSAYKIRISWSGANTNMPELVFLCQFDAFGSIQGIIDSENRTWQICN